MPTKGFVAFAIFFLAWLGVAHAADPLPAETRLVAAAGAAAPTQMPFTVSMTQDLVVTLTDLQVPGALLSAGVVVTQGSAIAGMAQLAAPATSATFPLPAANGDYTLYVFGVPSASFSVGTFTVCVAPQASPSNCIQSASLSGNITAPSTASDPTISTLSSNLTVVTQGVYKFNFADLQFPVALRTPPNLALFQGGTVIQLGITAGMSLTLSPGTYTLLGIAQADQTVQAGLYGITISGPAGTAPPLDMTVPVGLTAAAAPFNNPAAQMVTLKVSDYGFPAPLASASALLTSGGSALGAASAAGGAMNFMAPAGGLELWTYGDAAGATGTFSADVSGGGADLYTTAQGIGPSGSSYAYAYVSPPLVQGAYQANAADLQFPSQLTGLAFAVAQNGLILQQSTLQSPLVGSLNFNAMAGNVVLLVSAQAPGSGGVSGNGLFDVNVQTTDVSAQLAYDKVQSVSATAALFDSRTINLGVNASFDASLTDLGFPTSFTNLALVVSHGSEILGKIYGGGLFSFPGTPGSYQLTFVATPGAMQQFGLYGVSIVYTPPVVTVTSSVSSAAMNSLVTLSWTAANATSCSASGGNWTGDKAASSGSEAVVLAATTTYTLTCMGTGGTTAQTVTVTATAAASSSHGGAVDVWLLIGLGALLSFRLLRVSRNRRVSGSPIGR